MAKLKIFIQTFFFSAALLASSYAVAQTVPASQTAGGLLQQNLLESKSLNLRDRIQQEKKKKEEVVAGETTLDETGPKVLVKKIQVENVTLLKPAEVSSVVVPFEGKELTLKELQKVADLLTDKYREKGYATSRAYIPPQTIKDGILIIRVVEGRIGKTEIRGNRYFSDSLLKKKLNMQTAGYFDYSALQRSMVYINEAPDRLAKAVLVPGEEPGTTDIIINVQDNYPFHAGFEFDNYGSRYIDKERYALVLGHNNLLGFDDKIYAKFMMSEARRLQAQQVRYTFPVTNTLVLGGYFVHSRTDLGEELEALGAGGKAFIYGIFGTKALIQENDLDVRLNFGFDYKKIENELNSVQTSRDALRVFKLGTDIDNIDLWGRTIFTAEMDFGVPDIFGGMDAKDARASRTGSGGKFQKGVFNLYRLQPMPLQTSLLLKNSFQYTNHNLTASEQFQIGGPTSVRGYPVAEYSGDKGFYSAVELSLPLYGLSRDVKVPFREESLYDTFRLVCFYDIGFVHTKILGVGEQENHTLKGWGVGARLNVSNDLSLRVEIGYPSGKTPSDGDHAHPWVDFVLKF